MSKSIGGWNLTFELIRNFVSDLLSAGLTRYTRSTEEQVVCGIHDMSSSCIVCIVAYYFERKYKRQSDRKIKVC
jgi:hypothetical protein